MRFGLGWRPELGASILASLDRVDIVEVIAEDFFHASADVRRALQFLGRQVPVTLHGTTLGLASSEAVDEKRLSALARVVEWLEPVNWSEHLAFVRGGGIEIGHLAAPPRNQATLEGLTLNVERARDVVGSLPLLENVASLLDPPLSTFSEGEWLAAATSATGCGLLLDLHNLHANAWNFGFDAIETAGAIPPNTVSAIHLAGGRLIERGRLLDDHRHSVPGAVYDLLARTAHPTVDVILERDGNYPSIDTLLEELDRARAVCATRAA